MPISMHQHNMITTPDGKAVLVIGGDPYPDSNTVKHDKIYELQCTSGLKTCKWITLEQKLKYARESFIAMFIPDSLANDLCQ